VVKWNAKLMHIYAYSMKNTFISSCCLCHLLILIFCCFSVQGTKVVRRKCTLDTSEVVDDEGVAVENECTSKSSANSVCEICKTDSCNSAPGQAAQAIGLLAVSGLLLLKLLL